MTARAARPAGHARVQVKSIILARRLYEYGTKLMPVLPSKTLFDFLGTVLIIRSDEKEGRVAIHQMSVQ